MIVAALVVSLILLLGIVCSAYAQSIDISSALNRAQKSLDTQQSPSANKHDTSLSEGFKVYENKKFGIKMQYPKDWDKYEEIGPVDGSSDRIFSVSYISPADKKTDNVVYAWFTIEKLNEKTTTEERKNTLYDNLNRYPDITQKIVQSPAQISGIDAFRTDYYSPGLGQNYIDVETIDNGLLYSLTFTSQPDTLNKHMTSINKMMQTAQIIPIDNTIPRSKESTITTPTTAVSASDKQDNCDSSYPDFCIPPPPPNLNCPDIPQKRFTVSGSDPHGFDRDNDGIGCES